MKAPRLAALLLAAALALSGCGGAVAERAAETKPGIVATVFAAYDWTRQILGDRAGEFSLNLLLDDGAEMHSYQPTASDIMAISDCAMFIYVGGESDEWVDSVLAQTAAPDRIVLDLLDILGDAALEEEITAGMQGDGDDGGALDEHVWLSLRNAALYCGRIAAALGELDPGHREEYAENAADYIARLDALDAEYAAAVELSPLRTVLFADRFPFRYLTDDFDLEYYAAFPGCSSETNASFSTILFLADKVDALGLGAVLTLESGDGELARTVVESTGAKTARILRMDSMQSATRADIAAGKTYLGAMESNLEVLKQALGRD